MTLAEKKAVISDFLARCDAYAEEKLRTLRTAGPADAEVREKIHEWSVYRKFTQHTLAELDTETLDAWLK